MSREDYKTRGETDDPDRVGVFGHNTATSGRAVGVEGRTESPEGYGLYTPDDARVDGQVSASRGRFDEINDTVSVTPERVDAAYGGDVAAALTDLVQTNSVPSQLSSAEFGRLFDPSTEREGTPICQKRRDGYRARISQRTRETEAASHRTVRALCGSQSEQSTRYRVLIALEKWDCYMDENEQR